MCKNYCNHHPWCLGTALHTHLMLAWRNLLHCVTRSSVTVTCTHCQLFPSQAANILQLLIDQYFWWLERNHQNHLLSKYIVLLVLIISGKNFCDRRMWAQSSEVMVADERKLSALSLSLNSKVFSSLTSVFFWKIREDIDLVCLCTAIQQAAIEKSHWFSSHLGKNCIKTEFYPTAWVMIRNTSAEPLTLLVKQLSCFRFFFFVDKTSFHSKVWELEC